MDADVPVVESGGKTDFQYAADKSMHFPPTKVDRVLHDGDTVTLGGTALTAHLTAGHTKGTTTWTLDETENGRTLHVVIVGSPNVNPGYKLVTTRSIRRSPPTTGREFQVLKSLPCDIFLGAHGGYFGLAEKYPRWKAGDHNAFIDPAGYKAYIADREQAFESELKKQILNQALTWVPHPCKARVGEHVVGRPAQRSRSLRRFNTGRSTPGHPPLVKST